MAILSKLVSAELPRLLVERRKDIMMESAGYELIKKEGFDEGIQQGIQQGMMLVAQEMVLELLAERFGMIPSEIEKKVKTIDSREMLKKLHRGALRVESLEEFLEIVKRASFY
jgi:hypothetical protein